MRLLTVIKSVRIMVFSGKSLIYDTKKVLPKISYLHTAGFTNSIVCCAPEK